jgi:TRAP-type uncharacterized transport system substrate-binding protein
MRQRARRWPLVVGALAVLAVGLLAWGVAKAPPSRVTLAVGGADGTYLELAETFRDDLARTGVRLHLHGDIPSADLIKALQDPRSGIDGGIIKGGYLGSLKGRLASAKARERHEEETLAIRSLGRLMLEPIWVFTRGDLPIVSLRDLEGKRILTSTVGSGTRRLALQLLRANGVNPENSVLIEKDLSDDARELGNGEADAAILILAPETDRIQKLLRVPDIRLMDFSPEAKAYTGRFPAISAHVMHRGSVEFEPVIPSADITLLATSSVLVVRRDLHPTLAMLLAHAVIQSPKSSFDKAGDPVLFHVAGLYPNADDPELDVPQEIRTIYKTGDLPFLLRTLAPMNARVGMPFAVTSVASSYGLQTVLLLIPTLTILLPLLRLLPSIYTWSVRRRLLYWYDELKQLEARLESGQGPIGTDEQLDEIERIDAAIRRMRVPLEFFDQLYDLRDHVDLIRRRLMQPPKRAVEPAPADAAITGDG